jgi:3-phenylpropionate/trans-cinnamate dioxygenase ferredoxin reductase subunit
MTRRIVVIGAGQAALSFAAKLRALGSEDSIVMLGDEPILPYQRPPLSKKYMTGEMALDRLLLRPSDWFESQHIETRLNQRVAAIDRSGQRVTTDSGSSFPYDVLVLATGSVPRRLPATIGGDLTGVHTFRTIADADAVAAEFKPAGHVLIVGGGYIGLEAASVAIQKGLKVTLIEAAERILQRVASAETSAYFRNLHRERGVDIREGVGLSKLEGGNGRVTTARLADGTALDIDFAIVGIGIVPEDSLAREAGLEIDNGIAVDGHCRTSDPSILAFGDCASFPHAGGRLRLESVPHAIAHGETAAASLMGERANYVAKPWFWSDQYDCKLQIAGLNAGYDSTVIRNGPSPRATSVWYYRGDRLIAVDAMNFATAYIVGRKLVEAGRSVPKAAIADEKTDIKSFLGPG